MASPESRCALENRLQEIWQRALCVESVGAGDNLIDLGGDASLLSAVLEEIRRAFGMCGEGLPITGLVGTPTIRAFADVIETNMEPPARLIVPLQPSGRRRPLFLVHAGGGYVFFYRALAARLAPDYPVYGIRAETSADRLGRPFHACHSVVELARRYVADMKAIQPTGPYFIGGASFGGVVAFEMARHLRSQGDEVGAVLLFSALLSPDLPVPPQSRIVSNLKRAAELPTRDAVRYVSRKVLGNVASQLSGGRARGRQQVVPPALLYQAALNLKIGTGLLMRYTPSRYDGRIAIFRAAADANPAPLWAEHARGGMDLHDMPGTHLMSMEEPWVATTAMLVRDYLEDGRRAVRMVAGISEARR